MTVQPRPRWDIFCRVVDNFGDAGVCWRLARQLAGDHGLRVTLWIDRPQTLSRMVPGVDAAKPEQNVAGVAVRRWTDPLPEVAPADVVVNAFVAGVPDAYVAAMAARSPRPRWIELEYLSPDPAFDTHHLRPSPHPRLALARTYWVPGFSAASGGLLRERDLFARRDAFVGDPSRQDAFWRALHLPSTTPGTLRVSMWSYPHAPGGLLAQAFASGDVDVLCTAPQDDPFLASAGAPALQAGDPPRRKGRLALAAYAFLPLDDFDRLLWACDLNFVRGEDSLVRALWAGKPMVWLPYRQDRDAYCAKRDAFLDRYVAGLEAPQARAYRSFASIWSRYGEDGTDAEPAAAMDDAWKDLVQALPALRAQARRLADALARRQDLAQGLVNYCENRL
jgi:uncharacterized repeat protein (TIGR03837 family)